ncbi:unnamed protein product [Rotaria sordida]|uniref:Uncharacterized protein n=1 Tax=Rotaria sordida TaxID=392033 RepID=A0A815ELR4_9BILA|nr:unnamed protein product [Rotaria sordida]CAF1313724.1 unnamed protein product [Rotaria sordida]
MHEVFNNHDQDIELIKQTDKITEINQTTEKLFVNEHSSSQENINEHYKELKINIQNKNMIENSTQQNPIEPQLNEDSRSNRSSETSQIVAHTASINLRNLLSYQDVMNTIKRDYHLHEGQEREIIMKLWLKGQTMISILQRFRYLLQDLNLDDKDFSAGLKQIREIINYANRDVHYLREKTIMLENQNHFLDNEFRRQLDRIVEEKNEQINRLIHIIDQTCTQTNQIKNSINNEKNYSSGGEELSKKFMERNIELQHEIETFRSKLDNIVTFINQKLDQQKTISTTTTSSSFISILQTAFENMQQTEMKLLELRLKSVSQQEENDLLKYLMEKSQNISNIEQIQLFAIIEQRSLEREIDLVRQELEITEKKTIQLEQTFENSDETIKFHMENLKLKCDILRKHIITCSQRLDEINQQNLIKLSNENQILKNRNQQEESSIEKKNLELEHELLHLRERYNELVEHANTLQSQLHEKEKLETNLNINLEQERQRADQIENEFKILKIKYEDVCERIHAATHQLEHLQIALEQTSRRCEQLEKEKLRKKLSEINAQSEHLSQNVVNVTAKYKDKLNTIKARLEQTERERYEVQCRNEQFQNDIEHLKNELIHKKELIFEKEKIIQDTQHKNREVLLQRQSIEERISNEYKRLNDIVNKNCHLEEELDRIRRNQLSENIITRQMEVVNDSSKQIEELKLKIDEFEQRLIEEKTSKESLQVQIKILEEENTDLRDIMNQMRKRAQYGRKEEKDRNNEIQQLIARAEFNARQYMTALNLTNLTSQTAFVKIMPLSSTTKLSS